MFLPLVGMPSLPVCLPARLSCTACPTHKEPKSGTSFMYEWAVNALMVTCSRLELLFGRDTCRVSWRRIISWKTKHSAVTAGTKSTEMKEVLLSFEPERKRRRGWNVAAAPDARCPCETVER